jgi:O-antigen ligase
MGAILCLYFVLFFSVWTYGAVMPKQLLITEIVAIIGFLFSFVTLIDKDRKKTFKSIITLPGLIPFILLAIYILVQAINNSYTAHPAPHYGFTLQNHISWLPNSVDTTLSLSSLLLLTTYYLIFLTTKIIINSKKRENFLILLIICNGCILAILATIQYLAPQKFELPLTGSFVNSNNYVAYINLLIPITLAYGRNLQQYAQNKQEKSHPGYLFYFFGAIMIYSVCTGASLTGVAICFAIVITMLFIELFPYFLKQKQLPMTMLKICAVTIPILIVTTMLYVNGLDKLKSNIEQLEQADLSLNGRSVIYDATWKMFNDGHQLYGIGIGTFRPTSIYYLRQDSSYQWYPKFAHSDALQYLTELGIVGFSLFVLFILSILFSTKLFKSFIRKSRTDDSRKYINRRLHNRMQIAILFGLAGLFAHSCVDFPIHIPAITITMVVLAALLKRHVPKKRIM